MTSAWFLGANHGVPQNETDVRATMEPIRDDPEFAESTDSDPSFSEFESDNSSELNGLAPRVKAGNVTTSEQYAPLNPGIATMNHNAVVDNQVATSGTAASREMSGEQGHGTMEYTTSLTPEIRDGAAFGNDYFEALSAPIQEGAGEYMTASSTDNWAQKVYQEFAVQGQRDAAMSSMYNGFLGMG